MAISLKKGKHQSSRRKIVVNDILYVWFFKDPGKYQRLNIINTITKNHWCSEEKYTGEIKPEHIKNLILWEKI